MNPAPRPEKSLPAALLRFSAVSPIDLTTAFGVTRRECEIAAILGLSARTVQVHDIETRTAAANHCYCSGAQSTESAGTSEKARSDAAGDRPAKRIRGPAEQRNR